MPRKENLTDQQFTELVVDATSALLDALVASGRGDRPGAVRDLFKSIGRAGETIAKTRMDEGVDPDPPPPTPGEITIRHATEYLLVALRENAKGDRPAAQRSVNRAGGIVRDIGDCGGSEPRQ